MFSWLNIGPKSFSNRYRFCERIGRFSSLWSCFGLWSACKTTRIQFQRIFFKLHFWDFLLVVVSRSLLFKFVSNWSKPWEILTQEWEWPLFIDSILISTFFFNLVGNWLQLPIWVQSQCSPESNLLVQIILHLLAMCTHDKPLNLWIVRILQCLSSWNTVRLKLWSGILHQYKIYSLYLVVIIFQFVPDILAIDLIHVQDHR